MATLAEKIKKLKTEKRVTTATLSEISGIPCGTLNKILSSATKSVKSDTLAAIAAALGVSPAALLTDGEVAEKDIPTDFGYVRVAAVTPRAKLGDTGFNVSEIKNCVSTLADKKVSVAVFPELCISLYTLSDLFYRCDVLKNCEKSLVMLRDFSTDYETMFFVGCPIRKDGKIYNCAVAICKGRILGVVPKTFIPDYREFYEGRHFCSAPSENSFVFIDGEKIPFGNKLIFVNEAYPLMKVAAEICEDLWVADSPSVSHANCGANLIVNLSCSNEVIGKAEYRRRLVSMQSAKCICAYAYADAGNDESSTDLAFSSHNIITENGKILSETKLFGDGIAIADVDLSFIEYERSVTDKYRRDITGYEFIYYRSEVICDGNTREYAKTPFVPSDNDELNKRLDLIAEIQSHGLMRRISQINCGSLVVGVSGGLDSTLALLVACRAVDGLNRPRKDVIAVTMPCFGTTERTRSNSVLLAKELGVSLREINIKESVLSHFRDIGHDADDKNVTYENAQARERTQVLMDIANDNNGIVIGTGDLSELALGWATYNGDHMSMYGVNASVPKTLIRYVVKYFADKNGGKLKEILYDILNTPVSPELLPADIDGKISQKTEDIVGPYVLHDFYLYHFVRNGFSPSKIYHIAKKTFAGEFDGATIYKWLEVFIKRFFAQQFKRSCLPDGVKVGSVSLSPRGDWRMPSDCSCEAWLEDLRKIKI
ncbi:MAG: NAD(+) synthase [Clostridia bacterium]|nr:NAD(+) synthase [Clostridia bacterium]